MIDFLLDPYRDASALAIILEAIAFVFGIASVWYARQAHILVYPTGLVATAITVVLLYRAGYLGDMTMNVYYSLMSMYGWWNWTRRHGEQGELLLISVTSQRDKVIAAILFALTLLVTWMVYRLFGRSIGWANWIDIFTSGLFFTAMWLMAHKKLENWTLWIIADVMTVPLYAWRGLGMLSLQYLVFTVLAVMGFFHWRRIMHNNAAMRAA